MITGVPGAFCAGTDLADLATVPGETRGPRGSAEEKHKWWPIAQARKPTIGAIDGPAVPIAPSDERSDGMWAVRSSVSVDHRWR